ncbi:hypothetical protein B0T24DRAFT_720421 [Lasiosphaeria ovina]|uniref:Uncharacterized protein n=1 Tax=Lasiosphaeria ovina TaxID=92902 RepID=A0AAE0KCT3_9PEZI|nr:hypothetical protein B0T24DRAFT_720421 [Lasiosphaeria ovina]
MPCLRGIDVSLTTEPGNEVIPEYPHPDGSSARLLGFQNLASATASASDQSPNPTIAKVHSPGSPFAIKYTVNSIPESPCRYIFFRLYINGRPVAAWGIDPAVRNKGKVVKSLWAPGSRHDGQAGIEGRNFVFLPGQENKSVAEDGGLIEVQVFRAKQRRARAPNPEEFRLQNNYGIAAPSIGLLDQPQDACYYDYHLIDPRDSPFATYRLHYRSWNNLKQLNLIPDTELELLRVRSPAELRRAMGGEHCLGGGCSRSNEGPSSCLETSDEAVFDDGKVYKVRSVEGPAKYFLKSPPELFAASSANAAVPQPSKALRDGYRDGFRDSYLQRPLPELPKDQPRDISRRSSASSAVSGAPSLTPSLKQYVNNGSFDEGEVEVGVAQIVRMARQVPVLNIVLTKKQKSGLMEDSSVSDYEMSPPSSDDSYGEKIPSPGHYAPTTGSAFEHGLNLFTPSKEASLRDQVSIDRPLLLSHQPENERPRGAAAQVSESGWLSRTPPPIRREKPEALRRMWSPRPGRTITTSNEETTKSPPATNPTQESIGNWI